MILTTGCYAVHAGFCTYAGLPVPLEIRVVAADPVDALQRALDQVVLGALERGANAVVALRLELDPFAAEGTRASASGNAIRGVIPCEPHAGQQPAWCSLVERTLDWPVPERQALAEEAA